jgi:hypothetical protein
MAKRHKKLTSHYFAQWRIVVAHEEPHTKGTRYYARTLNWYAFPIESESSEFRDAVHQGFGGIEKAETKLTALYYS